MGILFRKRVKILPGVHINVSKSGLGLNVGVPGANITLNKRGTTLNTGIPGTGIYSREKISANDHSIRQTQVSNINSGYEVKNTTGCLFASICYILAFVLIFCGVHFAISIFLLIAGFIMHLSSVEKKSKVVDNIEEVEPKKHIIEEAKDDSKVNSISEGVDATEDASMQHVDMTHLDPLFEDAARLVVIHQQGSTSLIQRKLAIGYSRSGRIMDQLECAGIVGESNGAKARDVFCRDENGLEYKLSHLEQNQFERLYRREMEEQEEFYQQEILNESSRLIKLGIDLEKEGMIDEAISVYEKSIIPKFTATHPYDRLMILYRKKKDYNNEIRVIKIAISVFMEENEKRAGRSIEENSSLYNQVIQALEENQSIKYEDGKYAFVQCNVMDYITRLEKAKRLSDKLNK